MTWRALPISPYQAQSHKLLPVAAQRKHLPGTKRITQESSPMDPTPHASIIEVPSAENERAVSGTQPQDRYTSYTAEG
jgi:hypothetical protein